MASSTGGAIVNEVSLVDAKDGPVSDLAPIDKNRYVK